MRPAKVSAVCPSCSHEFEAKAVCLRHLPAKKGEGPKKSFTSRKFTSADDIAKKIVKDRDNWTCRRCGKDKYQAQMHAAHIYNSNYKALRKGFNRHTGYNCCLRHDPRNMLTLCAGDHIFWAHRNPHAFVAWVKEEIGEDGYQELTDLARKRKGAA